MRQIKKGSTDISVDLYIIDSTDGTPETGVLWNTSGIDLKYRRELEAEASITEASLVGLTSAHTDGGFLEIGYGSYRLDIPDAAIATSADKVTIFGTVTGMIVLPVEIQLVDFDPEDSTRLGLTALPNANADAAGGLPISDAGGLDLDAISTNTTNIETDTQDIQSRLPAALIGGRMSSDLVAVSGDTTAADNLELDYDGTGYNKANSTVGTVTTNTDMRGTDNAATYVQIGFAGVGLTHLAESSICTNLRLSELDSANMPTDIDNILVDTNSLNDTKIPDTISLANINAEVDTALITTTYAEPGQGAPSATASIKDKLGYMYKFARNKITNDGTNIKVWDDAGTTIDQLSPVTSVGGTVTRGEFISG